MIVYYSNPNTPFQPQSNPNKSLGGYPSTSIVPNGILGNIFPSISQSVVDKKLIETRLIVLKNTFSTTKSDIKIFTTTPVGSYGVIKLGLSEPTYDVACSVNFFESISSPNSIPYYSELETREGVDNALEVVSLTAGQEIGIWLMREISEDAIEGINTSGLTCLQVEELLVANSGVPLEETIELEISWT